MAKREHTISKTSKEIPMCMAVLTATTKPIGVTTDKYFLDTALTAVQRWRTENELSKINWQKVGRKMRQLIYMLAIVVTLQCTAYTHSTNPTASGVMPQVGHCAVDKINGQWIPFGTRIITEDGRTLVVTDRFVDGRSNCLDIFMASESECWQFGRKNLVCRVEIL